METMIKKTAKQLIEAPQQLGRTLCFLERGQAEPRSRAATGRLGRSRS